MDIEFIAQTLQLLHAHARPEILDANTVAALKKLGIAELLKPDDAALLLDAAMLQQSLTQTARIALDETLEAAGGDPGAEGAAGAGRRRPGFRRPGTAPDGAPGAGAGCLSQAHRGLTGLAISWLEAGQGISDNPRLRLGVRA